MLGLLVFASSAVIMAGTAEAAEIVEVRIGKHADFTRVVFELDRPAGYRIERVDPTSDVAELVISLEATSIPRRIKSYKSLIVQVEIEPSGPRSIARIRLARPGLRLKEMILSKPPRIVLDIISDAKAAPPVTQTAAPAPPEPVPVPIPKEEAVPSFDEPTFDEIVAQLPTESEAAADVVETTAESTAEIAIVDEPSTSTPVEEPNADEIIADEPETLTEKSSAPLLAESGQVEPKPQPKAQSRPRPMVVKSEPTTESGGGWMTWAFVGLGVIVLLLGGVRIARRMGGGEEVDFANEGESKVGDADTTLIGQAGKDENPFGSLSGDDQQMTLGKPGAGSGDSTIGSPSDEEKESESVVLGGSEEKSMEEMEVISRQQVNESLGGMPSAVGGIPEEFQQMMREMNRRVESLEGRIDELVDARDRLERQVAAQTEELRVQRAAIARTQRAVRNLARPEEGDGEQEPTEPALREPNPTG